MKLLHVFTLCLIIGLSFATDNAVPEDNEKLKPKPHTTTTKPTTTTTITPSTTTATPSTPPPTSPTTIPTTPSTPSTPEPTTAPTPSPTPPPTSPSTSPAPTPSTTAAPLPKDWIVRDQHDVCIVASMDITFTLHSGNVSSEIKIDPSLAPVKGGQCGNHQVLKVGWQFGNENSSITIKFSEKDKNYFISGLELLLAYNTTEGIKVANFSSANLTLFETSVNSSYSCSSAEFPEQKNELKEHVDIKLSEFHFEAFKSGNSSSFSSAHYCSEVPDIVPLVVGICLAVLVLVVVVAYLIGRRRSQASGYLSM